MTIKFADYDGPTGFYVATGQEVLPLSTAAGAIAFVGSAAQSGIGDPQQAAFIQSEIDAAFSSARNA